MVRLLSFSSPPQTVAKSRRRKSTYSQPVACDSANPVAESANPVAGDAAAPGGEPELVSNDEINAEFV
jgi:hypothetical protein